MMIFLLVFLSIHTLVNLYIAIRGYQALELVPKLRPWFILFMILVYVSYMAGRSLEKIWYHPVPNTLHWIGAFWFAAMLYTTLMLLFVDFTRIINLIIPIFNKFSGLNSVQLKFYTFLVISSISVFIMIFGHINAWNPKITHLNLNIPKESGNIESVRIVVASDIHLGTIIGPRRTEKLVKTIQSLNPDIILFPGDVMDEDVKPVIEQNLGKCLQNLRAPLGVYSSTGNHEYIGGGEPSIQYLEQNGVTVVRDTAVLINNSFYLIGREDIHQKWTTGKDRKTLEQLKEGVDTLKPIILLDHQPNRLNEAEEAGIDLQLSGHTHHGQLWPLSYITKRMFEVSWGYKQKGNSLFYVSSGFGTWGPPVRTGNRPEIVVIDLHFEKQNPPGLIP